MLSQVAQVADSLQNTTDANNHGGAIKLVSSNADIEDCIFKDNHSLKTQAEPFLLMKPSVPILKTTVLQKFICKSGRSHLLPNPKLNVIVGGLFIDNYANFGGGVATNGTEGTILKIFKYWVTIPICQVLHAVVFFIWVMQQKVQTLLIASSLVTNLLGEMEFFSPNGVDSFYYIVQLSEIKQQKMVVVALLFSKGFNDFGKFNYVGKF